jgi:hypothetical protein
MANRRHRTVPVRPAVVVATVLICTFIVVSAVGYTMHRNRNEDLRKRISRAEVEIQRLRSVSDLLDQQISDLRSSGNLQSQKKRFGLALDRPRHDQYLPLVDPVRSEDVVPAQAQLAGGASQP